MTKVYEGKSGGSAPSGGRAEGEVIRFDHREYGSPSTAVVEAVAAATDRDPTELPPLHGHVDTDALDAIVDDGASGEGGFVSVSFVYDGVEIDVDADGRISVRADEASGERVPDGPRTAAGLHAAMQELLRGADRNGVDVLGGWEIRNGPAIPDWDVHVTQLEKLRDEDAGDRSSPR